MGSNGWIRFVAGVIAFLVSWFLMDLWTEWPALLILLASTAVAIVVAVVDKVLVAVGHVIEELVSGL